MRVLLLLLAVMIIIFAASVSASDLYHVIPNSTGDAEALNMVGVEPVLRTNGGYLVFSDEGTVSQLERLGIKMIPIASGVTLEELALDHRMNARARLEYPVIFEQGELVLYRISPEKAHDLNTDCTIIPIRNKHMAIEYSEPMAFKSLRGITDLDMDLMDLIDLVNQDSLQSYIETLQQWIRYTGSADNYASRDWIYDKLASFGYDSLVYDSFVTSAQCMNVLAYKIGTYLPEHYIIVGAHRDAVSTSPGADDNGSGTAAVLEMARILHDIPTDVTIIFALFDAEEQGLHGSEHYADAAAARGDSIIYMLNMDMIAHYTNTNQVKLYHGTETEYTLLFQGLADSLLGVTGNLMGNTSGSDHYSFSQNGYQVTFAHEQIFSTVYHSYQDSSSYMSFPYMTKIVKACLATAYTVDQTYIPGPSLTFDYPDDIPYMVQPNQATTFELVVDGFYGGVPIPGTAQLYYSIDGDPMTNASLTSITANRYSVSLPAIACDQTMEFYFSAEEETVGVVYNPDPGSPYSVFSATAEITAFADDFESDLGWQISGGQWARGIPTGGGGQYGGPDPTSGSNGPNVMGYNLNGDYGNSLPEYHSTSPAIDCSAISGTTLRFMRWLGVEQPSYDHAYIRISTNGTTWTTLWENTAQVADADWHQMTFDISSFADGESAVYLRFTMGTTDGSWQFCGWNIDDITVVGYECQAEPLPLSIVTESLPDCELGTPYSYQLTATGGIQPYMWSDKYGDLVGTGLSLEVHGLLSGIPVVEGVLSFTAVVSDRQPVEYEKYMEIHAIAPYVCGDSNGDDDVNIGDAVYIINYVFKGGPAPAPLSSADANTDGDVNVADAVYLVNYIFKGGPAPVCW